MENNRIKGEGMDIRKVVNSGKIIELKGMDIRKGVNSGKIIELKERGLKIRKGGGEFCENNILKRRDGH